MAASPTLTIGRSAAGGRSPSAVGPRVHSGRGDTPDFHGGIAHCIRRESESVPLDFLVLRQHIQSFGEAVQYGHPLAELRGVSVMLARVDRELATRHPGQWSAWKRYG